ncbi:4Fe-4S binding domain-containing protein [Selenomonas sp. GACV-9]|uniref:ATP-binding protein n=1 Tax=Selenomonas sp. GACV-9 TaxID=3158782 RepID=UPI0008F0532A|nr:4Fe-4S binding domain-containing protein [Selenomonas ruminantium]
MAKREIDLNRCLFHYTNVTCNRCETICPQQAIKDRQIDADKCDNCGLCTAICPTGAIYSDTDYDSCLTAVQNLEPQVLMCQKTAPGSMPCLGALNRRLLWALASQRPLALATSHCASCNPAVAAWLEQEIAACNAALQEAGKAPLKLVRIKGTPAPASPVPRRSFFRSLFTAAKESANEIAAAQVERQYAFDPVIWLAKQDPAVKPATLFPGLSLKAACNSCGLCTMLCPEKALKLTTAAGSPPASLQFSPSKCTACGLCVGNCPRDVLELLPAFQGITDFPLDGPPPSSGSSCQGFTLSRG